MFDLKGVVVMVIDAKLKPGVKTRLKAKREAGECFQCDEKAGRGMRHLCKLHFGRFHAALRGLSKTAKANEEAKMISEGMVDESHQGRRAVNEFREFMNA